MTSTELKKHLIDIAKGTIGAMVTTLALAFLQFLLGHIPEIVKLFATVAGGVAGVKSKII